MKQFALILNRHGPAHDGLTFGQRSADWLAKWAGSWWFVLGFMAVLIAWIGLNSAQILFRPFDPFPYILCNLVLSCLAAFQAPIIMMSQNRQAARDRQTAEDTRRIVEHIEHDDEGMKAILIEIRDMLRSRHGRR